MDTDQDAPQKGPDNDSDADDGMGMFEHITKKELKEKFASKAQQKYMFANEPEAAKKLASKMTKDDYKNLPQRADESINRKTVENWLFGLVEKYERPSMSKGQFLQTLNEIAVMSEPAPATPKTRPGIKPGTTPGKPDRKSPYKPKHKPNPKAEDADSDIEDAKNELPAWMDFDSLFIKNEDE